MVSSSSVILLVAMIFATVYVQADSSSNPMPTTAPASGGTDKGSTSPPASTGGTGGIGSTSTMSPGSKHIFPIFNENANLAGQTTTKFVHSQQTLPALAIGTIALCLTL